MTPGAEFTIRIGSEYEGAPVGRFRISVTSDEFPEVMPEPVAKILRSATAGRSDKDRDEIRKYFLAHPYELRRANEQVAKLVAEKRTIENKIPTTMVMQEMAQPRDTFLLLRGQYDKPGDPVKAGVPAFLPPLPSGAPANRLTLARWLVDPANPLTARVAVNRYWQAYFGTGLVKTSEDFGSQGEAPSHPELLDWLATEFVRSGWDVKAMQRLIVTSATYRQASQATSAMRDRDPENRLLARGPRVRLAAEMIRDQALSVAGLLNDKMGGPAVKIYQPDGLWEQLSAFQGRKLFERSKGEDLWRRSVYTYWKRTVPPPSLTIFDAPTREFCVVRRQASSTPLQALALLNDEMYIEASRKFAERMMKEGGVSPAVRLAWAFRLATSRAATTAELAILERGFSQRLAQYRADPASAAEVACGRRGAARSRTRRRGTGRLHHHRRRHPESGRGDYAPMNPLRERELMMTRRQLFGRAAGGIGTAALASLLRARRLRRQGAARLSELQAESQARHLPAPIGRALADGSLRSQTQPRRPLRRRAPRFHPPGPAPHRHDVRAEELPRGAFQIQIRAVRQGRNLAVRTAAAHRPHRRRYLRRQESLHRGHQSRSRHHLHPDRQPDRGPAVLRLVGLLRPGQREPGPARRSSS